MIRRASFVHSTLPGRAFRPGLFGALFLLAFALGPFGAAQAGEAPAKDPPLRRSTQLLLVTAPGWDAAGATAQRYERSSSAAAWHRVGKAFPVVLGKAGLAWRSDEGAPAPLVDGPRKREGDLRSPAGIMPLGSMWGYGEKPPTGVKLPYHHASEGDRCVDDVTAPQYGKMLPAPPGGGPWKSAERMRRGDELYKYLIVVGYNMDHPMPGAGSCIFLHLFAGEDQPTVGCTAMSEAHLLLLSRWLDPARHPLLVQLPAAALSAARKAWAIP